MKYIKTYELVNNQYDFLVDNLLRNIDDTLIELESSPDILRNYIIIYDNKYKITRYLLVDEFGTHYKYNFYLNNELKDASNDKLKELYDKLLDRYNKFKKDVDKYNL